MRMQEQIETALRNHFKGGDITVQNQSHLHAGHSGDDGSGESHFKIIISSEVFETSNRITRERMIHKALGGIMNKIHALSISVIKND